MEDLKECMFEAGEIPTKIKTAFTREYNKSHKTHTSTGGGVINSKKRKYVVVDEDEEEGEREEGEGEGEDDREERELNNLADDIEMMEI
jgi:hypothetical protein